MHKCFTKGLSLLASLAISTAIVPGIAFADDEDAAAENEVYTEHENEPTNETSAQDIDLLATTLPTYNVAQNISKAYNGEATSSNNYVNWGSTMGAFLYENSDGNFVRVQLISFGVLVEEWTPTGEMVSINTLPKELSAWGGFYSAEDYNYIVFGENNYSEDDNQEVLRIVKYSKDWQRLDSCSVYGANTYTPFSFGNLRMLEIGNELYIYTAHQIYSIGGNVHQTNMTFVINQDDMSIEQSFYGIGSFGSGYITHSFNEFILTDGEYIYRVDHGDAYPRAVTILRMDVGGNILENSYTYAMLIPTNNNSATYNVNTSVYWMSGVSVGAAALSEDSILVAGNATD
ncbi:MAG: hypothetical protein LUB61_06555, partial [Eggerthellaceae bacterium]|nr:hypothetical protein [Eggerthellaceae bacterium]